MKISPSLTISGMYLKLIQFRDPRTGMGLRLDPNLRSRSSWDVWKAANIIIKNLRGIMPIESSRLNLLNGAIKIKRAII